MHKCRSYKYRSYDLNKSRGMYALTHIHPTKIVMAMSRFTASGLHKDFVIKLLSDRDLSFDPKPHPGL